MTTVLPILLPLVLGVAYYRRVAHLARDGHAPSTARQVSFAGGLLLLAVATVGPMDSLGDDLVFGHMIQHTILTDEAALLLAIGLTGPVLRPILSAPGLRHLRALMHPVVAIVLWIVVIYAWHVPPLYQAAAEHTPLHLLEHASFLDRGPGDVAGAPRARSRSRNGSATSRGWATSPSSTSRAWDWRTS